MGLAFGFGWTPCVGPALASILILAAGTEDLFFGSSLLLVYGISMTFPFVLAAIFAKPFLNWFKKYKKYLGVIEKIMGLFLIIFALLIVTNTVNYLAVFLVTYFPWLTSLG
jgi:cytochrome c-type biogenesis protein